MVVVDSLALKVNPKNIKNLSKQWMNVSTLDALFQFPLSSYSFTIHFFKFQVSVLCTIYTEKFYENKTEYCVIIKPIISKASSLDKILLNNTHHILFWIKNHKWLSKTYNLQISLVEYQNSPWHSFLELFSTIFLNSLSHVLSTYCFL